MYTVEIKHPNPAIGAKNKKFETQDKIESCQQFSKWIDWLDARKLESTSIFERYVDADGYEITWSETSANNIDDLDYDPRN